MLTCINSLVAEGVVVDQNTHAVSVFNILDDLVVPGFPMVFPKLAFWATISREQGDPDAFELNFTLSLNEQIVTQQQVPANFFGQHKTQVLLMFGGIPVMHPGTLYFRLVDGAREVSSYKLLVRTVEGIKTEVVNIASNPLEDASI